MGSVHIPSLIFTTVERLIDDEPRQNKGGKTELAPFFSCYFPLRPPTPDLMISSVLLRSRKRAESIQKGCNTIIRAQGHFQSPSELLARSI